MIPRLRLLLASIGLFLVTRTEGRPDVVINELMYHPASENTAEEYIELFNNGPAPVDVGGWMLTSGVSMTIPAGKSIAPSGYLVLAANAATFAAKYPAVTNVVAGWTGRLSNSANKVTLVNAAGGSVDSVSYADDGDWAERRRDNPADHGHRGWGWQNDADGLGKSLELINALFDNDEGQNWAASTLAQGTPGAANSVAAADIAPIIDQAEHFPLVPKSTESVTVTCRVRDDHTTTPAVQLYYRNDGAATFTSVTMFDNGAHGDAAASDGIFGATIPTRPSGTIVEFYFSASDGALTRTWPAPARDYTGTLTQTQNCLYQVDDTVFAGAQPIYRMVMRAVDKTELNNINTNTGTAPFGYNAGETNDQTYSHAKFNSTFISVDGTGSKLRYLAGVRDRGNGSRLTQPISMNISFQNGDTWNGLTGFNLNTQYTPYQLLGSALYRKSGLVMAESRAVQVRWNGVNPTSSTAAPAYGFYVANEEQNSEFADHHFPLDSSGNLYRGQRILRGNTAGGTAIHGADLSLITPAAGETQSLVDLYKLNYFKQTNSSEDDWSDLISLTAALAKGHSGATHGAAVTYDADYVTAMQARSDVAEWMRFMAVNTFADNTETNISNGDGDDYYIYFGINDGRGKLIPYDLDSVFGRGSGADATHSLFRMVPTDENGTGPTPLNAFMKHPLFAPLYYAELKRLLDGPFSAAQFDPLVDEIIGGLVPASVVSAIKTFNTARYAYIASQVPLFTSVTSLQTTAGVALAVTNGYPKATAATCKLIGKANAVETRSVKVNGAAVLWSAWEAQWTAASVALTPGLNRILIQAFDGSGAEIDRAFQTVWYDDTTIASVSGSIAANTTWTAAGGPYQVTAALSVASGATLTIAPGTSIYLASGVGITVAPGGRLIAEGTEATPIRFTRAPGATTNGGTITINGQAGVGETHFYYCYFEFGGDPAVVATANSNTVFDYCEWARTDAAYLHLDGGSFLVSNCIFPSPSTTTFEGVHGSGTPPAGGRAIIRDSFFGKAQQYNDVIDFTGGNRPGTIIQFLNNVFIGSDDDCLDIDGTDAWVEGNIFMHVHRNGSPDSASAVSGGNDSGNTSQITIVGNLFYDVDQAATAKQGNFYTFLNNTVVDQNGRGSGDTVTGVLNFADAGIAEASGLYAEGNIIHSAAALVRNYPGTALAGSVTLNNNLLPPGLPWTGLGSGNSNVDPRFANVQLVNATAASGGAYNIPTPGLRDYQRVATQIRAQFGLLPGSPGKGTGPNGTDKGGVRAFGVSLSGAPIGTTNQTTASVVVGTRLTGNSIPSATGTFPNGSGWTHYKYQLNGGGWSAETSIATPIALSGLANGVQTLDVAGKNDAGFYQDDAAFGADARVSTVTWIVNTAYVPPPAAPLVQINEVLANNTETVGFSGNFPDIIELRNAGNASADISGWGLTDNAALPYKYTIPGGTTLAPGAYLVYYASGSSSVPQPRTGFGLKATGDTLTLTRSAAAGGGVADSVPFGNQLADYSIGRGLDGVWALCRPTFTTPFANVPAATGPLDGVKINEWLADAAVLAGQDFIELMNTMTLPVNVGLSYLTENPADWPQHSQLRQLTFIPAGGYLSFKADDDVSQGPDHVSFKLDPLQGEIALFSPSLTLVDNIVYDPQSTDVSQGRTPNGTSKVAFFTQPTPGGPNPGATGTTSTTVNLIPATQLWKYFASATAAPANDTQGNSFTASAFNDAAWSSGGGVLYLESSAFPTNTDGFAETTLLPPSTGNPYQTYYFRTHFTFSGDPASTVLTMKMMCDDGAVLYLNGVELTRIRMNAGAMTYTTVTSGAAPDATIETVNIPVGALVSGDNVLVAEVHQPVLQSSAGPSSDITWGMKLNATINNVAGLGALVINEVLPINATLPNPDGSIAGWIELYNPAAATVSLADASLSDDPASPRRFIFPTGATITSGSTIVVNCNPLTSASATNTGFALAPNGGSVLLFEPRSAGGGLHDAVSYGRQIPDYAIGRTPNGSGAFALTLPTRGGINSAAGTAAITSIKINEWLANPTSGDDFVELYNTTAQPVALGGTYLTDQLSNKAKSLVPALSYLGGAGGARWQAWIADNDSVGTPGHVSFSLENGESLGLFSAAGTALDVVSIGTLPSGQSGGRFADGSSAIVALTPTPGAANQLPNMNDADGDGIPDSWELANGLDPNNAADAALDADGDGQSNLAEYLAGTNPQSAASRLAAAVVPTAMPGQYAVRFTAVAGRTYTIRYKNDLTATTWTKLLDVSAQNSDTLLDITDPDSAAQLTRFYQVVTPKQP